jgi:hypothetical protein
MANGSTYPIFVADDNGETRLDGNLTFADSTNQPAPSSNSIVSGTALSISGLTGSTVASRYVGQTASGSPASGAHLVGDFSTSTLGEVFVCSVAGTPGTWIQVVAGTLAASALTNAMVANAAAIAYSKLALTGSIVNTDIGAAAAIAASKLAAGLAGQVLQGTGPTYAYPPGFEIAYDQITSGVNVASTTEGTPTAIIAGTSHTYENVPYVAHFFSPQVTDSSAAAGTVTALLIADGASIGRIAVLDSVTATTQIIAPVVGELRFTPTAGAHTYGISAFASSATGTPAVGAGAGGINTLSPAFLRITKA